MLSAIDRLKIQAKYKLYKNRFPFNPVFLIGCGRSGTTILGHSIGSHPEICYLNERLDIWNKAYPEFDIWSGQTAEPILEADETHLHPEKTTKLRYELHLEQAVSQSKLVLEKTPINNFRLTFLQVAFPNARYVYLHRNGLDVARSIERLSSKGGWYGKNGNSKWQVLKRLIEQKTTYQPDALSFYEKALLEWRFSMERSEQFFNQLDSSRFYSLSYASFLENPAFQLKQIYDFLNLEINEITLTKAANKIERKSDKLQQPTHHEIELGGPYLKLSVENKLRQSSPNAKGG